MNLMNLRYMNRKLWVMFMDIIGPLTISEPVPIEEAYSKLLSEKDRLNLEMTYSEFIETLKEMENRGIIKMLKRNNKTYIMLTDEAKYFLITYSPAWIGL
jgi:predicted transcriptional regulator